MSKQNQEPRKPGDRREALRAHQQAQAAAQKRGALAVRITWITGLVVVAAIIGVIIFAVTSARSGSSGSTVVAGVTTPKGATENGALAFGQPSAKVTVSIYADFMCPYCGQFERANGADINAAVAAGKAKLEIHPMSFLDQQSGGTRYSTRAANAFVTVADADPAAGLKFYEALFANQPAEGTSGLSDAQLVDLAQQAGAGAATTASFSKQTFAGWVDKITQQAFSSGITGTPTVKINGQLFTGDLYTPGQLAAAIDQAANG